MKHMLVLLACLATSWVQAADLAITLDETLTLARDNLDVKIATRGLAAAQADWVAANHSPLPQLSAKLSQIDLQQSLGSGNQRIDKGLGIDWTWERGDKRTIRSEGARQAVNAATWDIHETRLQQLMAAQAAFHDLSAAQQRLEDLEAMAQSALDLAKSAKRRLAAGDLSQQEVDRTDIEAKRAQSDVDAMQADLVRARLALAQLIGRESEAQHLKAIGAGSFDQASHQTVLSFEEALAQLAKRSDVQSAQARVQVAQSALAAARAQQQTDLTWGASLDSVPGTSSRLLELRVQMPLLWGYKYQGEEAKALAQLDLAKDQLTRAERSATAEIAGLNSDRLSTAQRAQRFQEDILPLARSVAQKAEIAFTKGALPLTDLLDARRSLRAALIESTLTRAEASKALSNWMLRTRPVASP